MLERWATVRLPVAAAAVFFGLSILPAVRNSPTFDESGMLAAGLIHLDRGRFEPFAVNPPLVRMLAAAPALALRPNLDSLPKPPSVAVRIDIRLGSELLDTNQAKFRRLMIVGRLVCSLLVACGIALTVRWAGELHGGGGAALTACLSVTCPMVLAHGSLMTADAVAAFAGLSALYRLRRWLMLATIENAILLGIAVGAALLCKFTWAVLLPPIMLILWILDRCWREREYQVFLISGQREVLHVVAAVLVAITMINAGYLFTNSGMRFGEIQWPSTISVEGLTDSQNPPPWVRLSNSRWLAGMPCPLPAAYLQGIDLQHISMENTSSSRSYLMGEWKAGGWWYYYLVGWFIKSPLPQQLFFAAGLIWLSFRLAVGGVVERFGQPVDAASLGYLSSRTETALLLLPITAIWCFVGANTQFSRHQRYVLLAYPLMMIVASGTVGFARVWMDRHWLGGRWLPRVAIALVTIQALSVLWHGPHWLSYFNEAAGGPKRGARWMLSSNLDWGQDWYYLRYWQLGHPEAEPIWLHLYGCHQPDAMGLRGDAAGTNDRLAPLPGWHAVSLNFARGQDDRVVGADRPNPFVDRTPDQWIGYSIQLFQIRRVEASNATPPLTDDTIPKHDGGA